MNDPNYTTIPTDMLFSLLLYSQRYAYGRQSYAPGQIIEWIRAYAPLLTSANRRVLRESIYGDVERFGRAPYRDKWIALAGELERDA